MFLVHMNIYFFAFSFYIIFLPSLVLYFFFFEFGSAVNLFLLIADVADRVSIQHMSHRQVR